MITKKTRLAVLARLIVFLFTPHDACAAPLLEIDSVKQIESRMDRYFTDPRSGDLPGAFSHGSCCQQPPA